jgi:hypothetical protein
VARWDPARPRRGHLRIVSRSSHEVISGRSQRARFGLDRLTQNETIGQGFPLVSLGFCLIVSSSHIVSESSHEMIHNRIVSLTTPRG